MIKMFMKMKY